jgi:hypothetical protein
MRLRALFSLSSYTIAIFISLFTAANELYACDPCALAAAASLQQHKKGSLSIGLSEQYSDFDITYATPTDNRQFERVTSFSTSQFNVGYDFTNTLGIEVITPLIIRTSDIVSQYRIRDERDVGIGDMVFLGSVRTPLYENRMQSLTATWYGGVKIPTGDTGSLERAQGDSLKHHPISSLSGGRILTEGTGSFDYPLSVNLQYTHEKIYLLSYAQYTIRTRGDHDYAFANDLIWSVGPGYYVSLEDNKTISTRLVLSGEHKERDRSASILVAGSQLSNLYLGPELIITLEDSVNLLIGADWRLSNIDRDALVATDYRIRAGLSYRFNNF